MLRPISHASFLLGWRGKAIYNDPVGGSTAYSGLPKADRILIRHAHGDHSRLRRSQLTMPTIPLEWEMDM